MKFFRIPKFVRLIFPRRIWGFSIDENTVYLTFDDGPHPNITPFVLDQLKKYGMKATFFCVGSNVEKYPEIFQRILDEGHQVGNHTFRHENASKVSFKLYLKSIHEANNYINSKLFRPPYGRLNFFKSFIIQRNYKIIMWSWLSYDFDNNVSINQILEKANSDIRSGDIIVLHDNSKITKKQKELLPQLLELLSKKKFDFKVL